MASDPITRFWNRVDQNGSIPESHPELGICWPRTASGVNGYSLIRVDGRSMLASRFAWRIATGEDIPSGLWALHTCDYPPCIRNDSVGTYEVNGKHYERRGHIWLGDHAANMADASRKNRMARLGCSLPGERHSGAKLTDADVYEIRSMRIEGIEQRRIVAAQYNVSEMTISDIRKRRSWKHLP